MNDIPTNDDESDCRADQGSPCDPDVNCPNCSEYWQRMEHEGFWDRKNHKWTERGWRQMMKEAVVDLKKTKELSEGLWAPSQETMPPDEVKKAESAISDFLTKNPSGYTISYGADSVKDEATISFNKANDYSGNKGQVIYVTPYKFKKDLYDVAKRIWQEKQNSEYAKSFPPTELNPEDVLKQLDASSQHVDWYHDQSDDNSVWQAGEQKKRVIQKNLEKAALINPEGAKGIVKKNFPRDKQTWANQFIDSIHKSREKYARMYKL